MAIQIARVMKNAGHFNYAVFAAAIEKKMTRLLHAWAAHAAPAELQVISPRPFDHNFWPLFRAWPLGVFANIADGLLDERSITRRCGFAEFQFAPSQNLTNILPRGRG